MKEPYYFLTLISGLTFFWTILMTIDKKFDINTGAFVAIGALALAGIFLILGDRIPEKNETPIQDERRLS